MAAAVIKGRLKRGVCLSEVINVAFVVVIKGRLKRYVYLKEVKNAILWSEKT